MTETRNPFTVLAFRSIKWKVSAGWVVVLILAFRYLGYPITSTVLILNGGEALPPLEPLNLADVIAVVGLPVGGAVADRLNAEG